MGAGKTSIGRKLAERLGLVFVDCDHALEARTGATVPVIFELEGEPGFRAREAALIAEVMQGKDQVVATGGGAVLDPGNRRRLCERGFVVYLQASVQQQLERLARDRSRPLLAVPDRRERLEALAAQRGPIYAGMADLPFNADGLAVATAAERLFTEVGSQWRRPEAA
ncbi:shikimate kinase [Arenimonas soli]|uniref:Shikimate kinase n=2 Tax=Arenimonas soli TaxID=2269504 RepID=A0ABQ1HRB5_9GAMM|nr:shikimate kinase [Arenimonas soli]